MKCLAVVGVIRSTINDTETGMELWHQLFSDWVGILSFFVIAFIIGMFAFFLVMFVGKSGKPDE